MATNPLPIAGACELLPWDSEFFGFPIARTRLPILDVATAPAIDAWCAQNNITLLYHLSMSDLPEHTNLAHAASFTLVDIRLTFVRPLTEADQTPPLSNVVRPATPADLPQLESITREGFHHTRFYADQNIPRDKCQALYETWIRQSVAGRSDAVFVHDLEGQVSGYITCDIDERRDIGSIGLMGVDPSRQRTGVGSALVHQALFWFASRGLASAAVVTQSRNIPAQRLYQRHGFLTSDVQLYYHKWYKPPP